MLVLYQILCCIFQSRSTALGSYDNQNTPTDEDSQIYLNVKNLTEAIKKHMNSNVKFINYSTYPHFEREINLTVWPRFCKTIRLAIHL